MPQIFHYEKAYLQIQDMPCEWQLYLKPKPYALSRMHGKAWKPDNPDFRILPATTEKPDPAVVQFISDIPEDYIRIMTPFPVHQWMLLRLLYEGKHCVELAQSNPVLAYCIANNEEFLKKPETRISLIGKLCLKKQKELMEWLGFPGTPAAVRLIQKIVPDACNPSILRMFRAVLKTTEFIKALGHLRQINTGVIAAITNRNIAGFVTPRLLLEISEAPEERTASPVSDLLFETCSMYETIRARQRIRRPVFPSIAGLQNIHDNLIPQYNHALTAPLVERRPQPQPQERPQIIHPQPEQPCKFGPPPVCGTEDILPITSSEDLIEEGREMLNCVSTYRGLILQRMTYIYRVENPERATLAIVPDLHGTWRVSQLKARRNRKVKPATLEAVNQWLDKVRSETWKLINAESKQ